MESRYQDIAKSTEQNVLRMVASTSWTPLKSQVSSIWSEAVLQLAVLCDKLFDSNKLEWNCFDGHSKLLLILKSTAYG